MKCVALYPKGKAPNKKIGDQGIDGKFVGYDEAEGTQAYRVLIPKRNKIMITPDVEFLDSMEDTGETPDTESLRSTPEAEAQAIPMQQQQQRSESKFNETKHQLNEQQHQLNEKQQQQQLNEQQHQLFSVWIDNQSSIKLAEAHMIKPNSKHIGRKYHMLREHGRLELHKIPGKDNPAYLLFTKDINKVKREHHRRLHDSRQLDTFVYLTYLLFVTCMY